MKRALPLAVLTLTAIAAGAAASLAFDDDRPTTGVEAFIPPLAVRQDPGHQRRVLDLAENAVSGCDTTVAARERGEYMDLTILDSDAGAFCPANAERGVDLTLRHFPTNEALERRVSKLRERLGSPSGDCTASAGDLRWTDAEGRDRGSILCGQDGAWFTIAWTDEDAMDVWILMGQSNEAERTWRRIAKPDTDTSRARTAELLDALDGPDRGCTESDDPISPPALTAVECTNYVGSPVRAVLYRDADALREALEELASTFRIPATERSCADAGTGRFPLEYGGPDRGTVLCFSAGGRHWYVWSIEDRQLLVTVSSPDGEREGASQAFSDVGSRLLPEAES